MNSRDFGPEGHALPLVEAFYTIQGEGFHAGVPAYFIRLGGCDVGCPWCDSRHAWDARRFAAVGADELARRVVEAGARTAVITGGEPLIWPLGPLTGALHRDGVAVFLETSGTHPFSGEFDWVCLSPKRHRPPLDVAFVRADEIKVVIDSEADLRWAEECAGRVGENCRLALQPQWERRAEVTPVLVDYVKAHPQWRISLQTHKFMDIP